VKGVTLAEMLYSSVEEETYLNRGLDLQYGHEHDTDDHGDLQGVATTMKSVMKGVRFLVDKGKMKLGMSRAELQRLIAFSISFIRTLEFANFRKMDHASVNKRCG
jgi:hypothetical protein